MKKKYDVPQIEVMNIVPGGCLMVSDGVWVDPNNPNWAPKRKPF